MAKNRSWVGPDTPLSPNLPDLTDSFSVTIPIRFQVSLDNRSPSMSGAEAELQMIKLLLIKFIDRYWYILFYIYEKCGENDNDLNLLKLCDAIGFSSFRHISYCELWYG
ncbi:hypothetical protein L6452_18213 [Arctium lappa]|uniref:Uncharacterized protein n=1 Tax=Arctium lappa TaxID=4217 RepID=A0ACB9C5U2_ARCLA|nr:hypothetical protein L6452_18213 [Arctium lappa]